MTLTYPSPGGSPIFAGTVTDGTADKFTFTLAASGAIPASFRVAIMVDNLDNIGFNASALTIHNAANTATFTTTELQGDKTPDMYVFQVDGAANGEQFFVGATSGVNSTATFAAVAYDVVPEPASLTLGLVSGLGMLSLRRNRRGSY